MATLWSLRGRKHLMGEHDKLRHFGNFEGAKPHLARGGNTIDGDTLVASRAQQFLVYLLVTGKNAVFTSYVRRKTIRFIILAKEGSNGSQIQNNLKRNRIFAKVECSQIR